MTLCRKRSRVLTFENVRQKRWRYLSKVSRIKVVKMPKVKLLQSKIKTAWPEPGRGIAPPQELTQVEAVQLLPEAADTSARSEEDRWAERVEGVEEAGEEDAWVAQAGEGEAGARFWRRLTSEWPLKDWFKYDGCQVHVTNTANQTIYGVSVCVCVCVCVCACVCASVYVCVCMIHNTHTHTLTHLY